MVIVQFSEITCYLSNSFVCIVFKLHNTESMEVPVSTKKKKALIPGVAELLSSSEDQLCKDMWIPQKYPQKEEGPRLEKFFLNVS